MLEVKHLSYTVTENQETLPIVTDISFTVNDGEMLVITGPNEPMPESALLFSSPPLLRG